MSEIKGIHQSDIVLRSALIVAFQRLRDDPELLDDVFESLSQDELTKDEYGDAQIERAKQWFLATNIPVLMSFRVDEAACPCVTISLQESTEAEQTHGDVHYITDEDVEGDWPALTNHFNPLAYVPSSGLVLLPPEVANALTVTAGMWLVDAVGRQYQIVETLDEETIGIQPGSIVDFRGAVIKGAKPRLVSSVESVGFRETYVVGCHVMSAPTYLVYLHSITLYCLLKYKEELLEARGLERTTLSSTEFRRDETTQNELMFERAIVVNGYVRQSWRKKKTERVTTMEDELIVSVPDVTGPPVYEDGTLAEEL